MTDDLKAPERIWATEDAKNFGEDRFHTTRPMKGLTEYIRADRIATLEAALADMTQQRDRQYDENVSLIAKQAKTEAERDEAVKEQDRLAKAWEAKHKYQVQQSKHHAEYFDKSQRRMHELVAERDAAMAGAVKVRASDEGPQALPNKYTCTGCKHLSTEEWKDYLDNDETDSGTYATCGKNGRNIASYWRSNTSPPEWCPCGTAQPALTPDPDRLLALIAAAEPVCYLPTKTVEWLDTYDGSACAKMTAVHNRPIKTDGGVPVYRIPANALAALSRIEAQAEARGMRICADIYYTRCCDHDDGDDVYREMTASADATEAAAKGGV